MGFDLGVCRIAESLVISSSSSSSSFWLLLYTKMDGYGV